MDWNTNQSGGQWMKSLSKIKSSTRGFFFEERYKISQWQQIGFYTSTPNVKKLGGF